MKFVLYGMPCAGKTTLLKSVADKIHIVNGSSWLEEATNGKFKLLSEEEKKEWRTKYVEYLGEMKKEHIISDGHYAFEDNVVFTEADGEIFDVFLYLYCEPEEILKRMQLSEKNQIFANLTLERIAIWQDNEIEGLRHQCHKRYKDFYVIPSAKITKIEFIEFIDAIIGGCSSCQLAISLTEQIRNWFPSPCELNIVDGDKTFINEDTLRICAPDFVTTVFDGDFYTGYQSYCFNKETSQLSLQIEKLQSCTINKRVWSEISKKPYIILSAGITCLWKKLSERLGIPYVLASPLISADTKYHVTKFLRESGYRIKGYGDSKNDLYFLKEANEGYLYLGKRISRSLANADVSNLHFLYDKILYILADEQENADAQDIAVCKSSSGVTGAPLAEAHCRLGYKMGGYVKKNLPNKNVPVIVLERGGHFLGDGFYMGFGGTFYPYNPKKDVLPEFKSNLVIIVDAVINSGKSIQTLIEELELQHPGIQICLVTGVIQKKALEKFGDYPLFAVRVSENKFVGRRQKKQTGNVGPDTADRLFNLL